MLVTLSGASSRARRWPALARLAALLLALGGCAAPAAGPRPATPAAAPGTVAPTASPAAAPPAATAAPTPLHVTLAPPSPGVIFLPYYLGQARGLYAAEGVDLELQVLPANTAIAALLAGGLDFTAAAGSAGRAAANGSPVRVAMGLIDRSMIDLHVRPDVADVRDLRGRQIAITSIAGTPAQVGRQIILAAGMDPATDVEFVQTQTTPNAYAALSAGGVPAALLDPPFTAMAERAGLRAIAHGRDYVRSTQGGLAAAVALLQEQPDKVARAIRGSLRSIAYTLDNEDDAVDYITATWDLSPDDARLTYRTLADGLVRDGLTAPEIITGELQAAGLNATADEVVDFGILRAVLAEPAFAATCAPRGGARPAGCRAP